MAWLRYTDNGRRVVVNLDHVQSATYNPGTPAELRLYPSVVKTAEGEPAKPWVLQGRTAQEAARELGLDSESGGARVMELDAPRLSLPGGAAQ
jgi:hypothetical protein